MRPPLTLLACALIASAATAQPRLPRIEIVTISQTCGTCAVPPGPPERVRGAVVVLHDATRRREIARESSDEHGAVRFAVGPGRYCVELEAAPGAPLDCFDVTDRDVHRTRNVGVCRELHCSGTEP